MLVLASEENGGAPVLAVFTIFILLSCALAISSFQGSDQRSVSATQQLVAADVTRATASAIEGELNQALATAVTAAMYDAGGAGENRDVVEQLTSDYLNRRISRGWSYPNLDVIIPEISGGELVFDWQPDGSVEVRGYIDAEIRHVYGPTAHGVKLDASVNPRFLRMENIAWKMLMEDLSLEADRYAAEGLEVELHENTTHATVIITDVFAAPCVMVGDGMEFVRYVASKEIIQPITPPPPSGPPPPPSQPPSPQPSGDFTLSISPSSGAVSRELGPTQTGKMTFSLPIPSMSWEVVGSHMEPVYGWVVRYSRISTPIYGWVTRYLTIYIPSMGFVQVPYPSWEVVDHLVLDLPYMSWEQVEVKTVYDYDWVLKWNNFTFDVPIYGDRYPRKGTSATVTVTPIGSYSHEVSLSLAAPGEVNASLGSRSLKPNPHDVSTPLTVEVPMSEDSRTGTYVINVVGEGADGKRREASYALNVKDSMAKAARIEPLTINPSGPPLAILPVYDGGSSPKQWGGGYVLPYQFLSDRSSGFTRPSDPELAKLFGVPGYIDPGTGEVRPFLVDELSEILLEKIDLGDRD